MTIPTFVIALALMMPSVQTESAPSRITRASIVTAVAVADALTTREALVSGNGHESNPLMKWASRSTPRLLMVHLSANALAAYALDRFGEDHPRLAWVLAGGLAALQTAIAVNNHRIAIAHRR